MEGKGRDLADVDRDGMKRISQVFLYAKNVLKEREEVFLGKSCLNQVSKRKGGFYFYFYF
jgi:hypothetical protein